MRIARQHVERTTYLIASLFPQGISLRRIESHAAVNKIGRYKMARKSRILHVVTARAKNHGLGESMSFM